MLYLHERTVSNYNSELYFFTNVNLRELDQSCE